MVGGCGGGLIGEGTRWQEGSKEALGMDKSSRTWMDSREPRLYKDGLHLSLTTCTEGILGGPQEGDINPHLYPSTEARPSERVLLP